MHRRLQVAIAMHIARHACTLNRCRGLQPGKKLGRLRRCIAVQIVKCKHAPTQQGRYTCQLLIAIATYIVLYVKMDLNKFEYRLFYKFVLAYVATYVTICSYFSPYEGFSCCSLSVPNTLSVEKMASYTGLLAFSVSRIEVLLRTIINNSNNNNNNSNNNKKSLPQ